MCFSCSHASKEVVFTVNDESISLAQYEQQLDKEKLMVISEFQNKYKATFGPGFWTMNFDGEIPANILKQRAVDAIVGSTIKKMMAREMGLVKKIGYEDFLKELDSVNKARVEAVKEGKVIYGPVTYQLEMYSAYYLSTLENAIKDKMSTPGSTPDEIRSKYNALVQERIQNAKININESVYEKIRIH
nr:hypothetical protein [Pedobacter panaciterrae]